MDDIDRRISPDLYDLVQYLSDNEDCQSQMCTNESSDNRFASDRRDEIRFGACSGSAEDWAGSVEKWTWLLNEEEFAVKKLRTDDSATCSPPPIKKRHATVDLLNYPFNLHELVLTNPKGVETLFNILRMQLSRLETMCERRGFFDVTVANAETLTLHQQICQILNFLMDWILRLRFEPALTIKNTLKQITFEFKNLILQLGRLHQMPDLRKSTQGSFSTTSYFHACLEVWYSFVKLFAYLTVALPEHVPYFRIAEYVNGIAADQISVFDQLSDILLSDLINMAATNFTDEVHRTNKYWCYSCSCVLKFYLLMHRLIDAVKEKENGGFWCHFDKSIKWSLSAESTITGMRTDRFTVPEKITASDNTSLFYWNFIRCLSDFRRNDVDGHCLRETVEYLIMQTISPLLTGESQYVAATEIKLQSLLSQYLTASSYLHVYSSTITASLWDYYSKRFGQTFVSQSISELPSVHTSSYEWLLKLRRIISHSDAIDSRSGFELFLSIANSHCTSGDAKIWSQLKGRVFTQLVPRRFAELSECGLFNFMGFLLSVAQYNDLKAISNRVLELAKVVRLQENANVIKMKIIWQAMCGLVLLHQEKSIDCGNICLDLAQSFGAVNRNYMHRREDVAVRRDLWDLIVCYFKLMREMVETDKQCTLDYQAPMWETDFQEILSKAKDLDLRSQHCEMFASSVAALLRKLYSSWNKEASPSVWSSIIVDRLLPAMRFVLSFAKWFNSAMDVWYQFIQFSQLPNFDRLSTNNLIKDITDMHSFNFDAPIAASFLRKVIDDETLQKSRNEEDVEILLEFWLICVFYSPEKNAHAMETSRSVISLWNNRQLLLCEQQKTKLARETDSCNQDILFERVCESMERSAAESYARRMELSVFAQRLFRKPLKRISPILINADPPSIYFHCAALLSKLVACCASLIHKRDSNDSLLREILGLTVCGVTTEKTAEVVKKRRQEMTADCMNPMLKGLLKCNWSMDGFIKNKILEMYRICLFNLATERSTAFLETHFLVTNFKETFPDDEIAASSPLRHLRLYIIKDMRLMSSWKSDRNVAKVLLNFLRCLTEKSYSVAILEDEADEICFFALHVWIVYRGNRTLIDDCVYLIQLLDGKLNRSISQLLIPNVNRIMKELWKSDAEKILESMSDLCKRFSAAKFDLITLVSSAADEIQRTSGAGADFKISNALQRFKTITGD